MTGENESTAKTEDLYGAQWWYCHDRGLPVFIEPDCRCPRCGRNIFGPGGYPPMTSMETMITGCPYCNASFCD